jgi:hypothetical protein
MENPRARCNPDLRNLMQAQNYVNKKRQLPEICFVLGYATDRFVACRHRRLTVSGVREIGEISPGLVDTSYIGISGSP